jgi:hypothetical protein
MNNLDQTIARCFDPKNWTEQELIEAKEHLSYLWKHHRPWCFRNRVSFNNTLKQINRRISNAKKKK